MAERILALELGIGLGQSNKAIEDYLVTLGRIKNDIVNLITANKALSKQATLASKAGIAANETRIRALKAEERQLRKGIDSINDATGEYEKLNKELQVNRTRLKDLLAIKSKDIALTDKQQKEYEELTKAVKDQDTVLKNIDSTVGQNQRNVGNYSSAIGSLIGRFTDFIKGGFIVSGVLAIANALKQLGRDVIDNNIRISDSFADVQKTINGIDGQGVADLAKQLSTTDTRTSIFDQLEIAKIGGQLGIAKEDIAGFVDSIDKVKIALKGDITGDTEKVAGDLGKLGEVFGTADKLGISTGEGILRIGSAINEIGKISAARGDNVVDFTKRLAGVATNVNITEGQLIGLGGTVDALGLRTELAATAIGQLLVKIGSDPAKFGRFAQDVKGASFSMERFAKLIKDDTNEALKAVLRGAVDGGKGLETLASAIDKTGLSGQRAVQVISTLGSNIVELERQQKAATREMETGNSVLGEFAIKNNNTASDVDKLKRSYELFTVSLTDGNGIMGGAISLVSQLGSSILNTLSGVTAAAKEVGDINAVENAIDKLEELRLKASRGIPFSNEEEDVNISDLLGIGGRGGDRIQQLNDLNRKQLFDNAKAAFDSKNAFEELELSFDSIVAKLNKDVPESVEKTNESLSVLPLTINEIKEKIKDLTARLGNLKPNTSAFTATNKEITRLQALLDKLQGKSGASSKTEPLPGSLGALTKELQELQKELKNVTQTGDKNAIEAVLQKIVDKEGEIKKVKEAIKQLKNEITEVVELDNLNDNLDEFIDVIADNEFLQVKNNQFGIENDDFSDVPKVLPPEDAPDFGNVLAFRDLQEQIEDARTEEQLEGIKQRIENEKLNFEQQNALYKAFQEKREDLAEKAEAIQNKRTEEFINFLESQFTSIADAQSEVEKERIERDLQSNLDALAVEEAARLAAVQGSVSQELAVRKEFEEKRNELEGQAASDRKGIALKEALIKGALAVLSALAQGNGLQAVAAGLTAATQLAVISAQEFAGGTVFDGDRHSDSGSHGIPVFSKTGQHAGYVEDKEVLLNRNVGVNDHLLGVASYLNEKTGGIRLGGKAPPAEIANMLGSYIANGSIPASSFPVPQRPAFNVNVMPPQAESRQMFIDYDKMGDTIAKSMEGVTLEVDAVNIVSTANKKAQLKRNAMS